MIVSQRTCQPYLYGLLWLCGVLFIAFSSSPAIAEQSQETLRGYLAKNHIRHIRFDDKQGIEKFYAERNYEPIWLRGNRLNKKAKQVLSVFEGAWKHGINPNSYVVGLLNDEKYKNTSLLEQEILLSAAVVRYGRDMTSMRVPPYEIEQKAKFWQKPLGAYTILNFVTNGYNTKKSLETLAPQSNIYKALQKELLSLQKQIEKGDETEVVLPLPVGKTLRLGDRSAIIEEIRYRLKAPNKDDPRIYDDPLSQKVMTYQEASGLKPDGIIGKKTILALNKTLKDRLDQVIVNLERVRWLDTDMPDKYIVVNIPAQTLWAIDDNKVVHEMPVIIGRPKRQTNSFVTKVTGVRFNPTWTVPETIKFEDYLPHLKEDPNYLNDKGIEFFWGQGKDALTLPPEAIQWEHLSEDDIDAIRIVQKSGVTNPLGRVRLHMPNQYNIYLHDTNDRNKFHRENRALSSGCIRMLEPEKIANFVLSDNNNWSDERMQELFDEGKMRDIWIQQTTPVYLLYQTIWMDDKGKLIYGHDVYDKDRQLMRVLKKYDAVL